MIQFERAINEHRSSCGRKSKRKHLKSEVEALYSLWEDVKGAVCSDLQHLLDENRQTQEKLGLLQNDVQRLTEKSEDLIRKISE